MNTEYSLFMIDILWGIFMFILKQLVQMIDPYDELFHTATISQKLIPITYVYEIM